MDFMPVKNKNRSPGLLRSLAGVWGGSAGLVAVLLPVWGRSWPLCGVLGRRGYIFPMFDACGRSRAVWGPLAGFWRFSCLSGINSQNFLGGFPRVRGRGYHCPYLRVVILGFPRARGGTSRQCWRHVTERQISDSRTRFLALVVLPGSLRPAPMLAQCRAMLGGSGYVLEVGPSAAGFPEVGRGHRLPYWAGRLGDRFGRARPLRSCWRGHFGPLPVKNKSPVFPEVGAPRGSLSQGPPVCLGSGSGRGGSA